MKNWIVKCCAALGLVPALAAVASPAHAACTVYLEEAGFTLAEGTSGILTVHRDQCGPGDYQIRYGRDPRPDFRTEVLQDGGVISVEAVDDGVEPETTDELVVEVYQAGNLVDSATVTILGSVQIYLAILTACDVKGREMGLLVDVMVSGQPAEDIQYIYDLVDGTAKAGEDYTPVIGGQGVIKLGQSVVHIPIAINVDGLVEGVEYFLLRLRWASGAAIADEEAVITIEPNAT